MRVLESYTADRVRGASDESAEKLTRRLLQGGPAAAGQHCLYEVLKAPMRTKLYFDYDHYTSDEPSADALLQWQTRFESDVSGLVRQWWQQQQPAARGGAPAAAAELAVGARHGWVQRKRGQPHRQFKVSFRIFVTNYCVPNYATLGYHIKAAKDSGKLEQYIDHSVYKAQEQLLGLIRCSKSKQDSRVLLPVDCNRPLHHFFASHVSEEECCHELILTVPDAASTPTTRHNRVTTLQKTEQTCCCSRLLETPVYAMHDLANPGSSLRSQDPVVKLLHLLSKSRWDDYASWINIGIALKNIGCLEGQQQQEQPDRYQEIWLAMSRISPKFDLQEANAKWESFGRTQYAGPHQPLSLKSLESWAAADDPIGFVSYRAATLPALVKDKFNEGDRGLAEIAHYSLRHCLKRCNHAFFHYDGAKHVWVRHDNDQALRVILSHALESTLRDLDAFFHLKCNASLFEASSLDASQKKDDAGLQQQQVEALEHSRKKVAEAVRYIRSCGGMSKVMSLAGPLFQDDDFEQSLDCQPHLLGVQNGVVDLRTGGLRPRTPADNLFTIVPCEYDPTADPTLFHDIVLSAMADDLEMARYLQKLLGYAVTGETCEEIFPVFTGSGRNCKGVLTQTMSRLFGSFYREMNPAIIVDRQVANIDAERGKLLGARIAVFNELRSGDKLKTNEVQLLSGGDGIPTKPLYKDPITIQPRHLCILSTNHMPELSEVIPAIMERMLCIHFPVTFTDLEQGCEPTQFRRQCDKELKTKLKEHTPAVLKWFVDGAVAWYASKDLKRNAPAKVKEFSRAYFEEQDKVAVFIRDYCRVGESYKVGTKELLCEFNYEMSESFSDKTFATAMKLKGFVKKPTRISCGGTRQCFWGVELANDRGGVAASFAFRSSEG
jgi:P4 family phage/plasmid primase-like protien